ncbi:hypothetical protein PR048_023051 [Dryococelus australis]|uniref:Cytochrome P450 n=1 Tax=Dryococelus australis TaxID=614101 RepID=A0ABQ9GT06_9NEOP|nr:hypothetical protein PR048_023051 [Dryococelus australis]
MMIGWGKIVTPFMAEPLVLLQYLSSRSSLGQQRVVAARDETIPEIILLGVIHLYMSRNYRYWKRKGVAFLEPQPFIGNLKPLLILKESPGTFLAKMYDMKPGAPYLGFFIFDRPALLLRDPDMIQKVLATGFRHFRDRFTSADEHRDPLGARNVFVAKGRLWRRLRTRLAAAFTSGNLRLHFPAAEKIALQLRDHLAAHRGRPADVKVHAAQPKHCTPIQHLVRRSEGASGSRVNVVLIVPAILFFKHAVSHQVDLEWGFRKFVSKVGLEQPVTSVRHQSIDHVTNSQSEVAINSIRSSKPWQALTFDGRTGECPDLCSTAVIETDGRAEGGLDATGLLQILPSHERTVCVQEATARAATDVVCCCVLGLDGASLADTRSECREQGRRTVRFSLPRAVDVLACLFAPAIMTIRRCKLFHRTSDAFFRYLLVDNNLSRGKHSCYSAQ